MSEPSRVGESSSSLGCEAVVDGAERARSSFPVAGGFPSSLGHPVWDRTAEHSFLEQLRSQLEAKINTLPDASAVVDLQAQVRRLGERVAELEQRLSRRQDPA